MIDGELSRDYVLASASLIANVPKRVSPEEEAADSPLAIRRSLTVEFDARCCALFQRVCSRDSGDASPSSLGCNVSFLGDIRHRLQPGCLGRFPMWRPFRPDAVVVREFCRALPTARPSILPDYLYGIGCIRRDACGLCLVPRWNNRGWAAPTCGETDNAKRQDKERTRRQRTEEVVCGGSSCRGGLLPVLTLGQASHPLAKRTNPSRLVRRVAPLEKSRDLGEREKRERTALILAAVRPVGLE